MDPNKPIRFTIPYLRFIILLFTCPRSLPRCLGVLKCLRKPSIYRSLRVGWETRDKVWLVTHVTAWLVHLCHRLHVLDCLCHRLHVLDCLCHRLHMLDCLRHCLHALMWDWFLHVFYASISMTLGNFLLVSK